MVIFCTIYLKQKDQDELEATYFDPFAVAPATKGIHFFLISIIKISVGMVWGGTHCFKCLVLARGFVTTKDSNQLPSLF
jgi:hypothetical protein